MEPSARITRSCRKAPISAAIREFRWFGLVQRRNATHGIGNAHPPEFETIIRTGAVGTHSKPEFAQRVIEQRAGIIAGERASGAVRAAQTRGEADDQQLG